MPPSCAQPWTRGDDVVIVAFLALALALIWSAPRALTRGHWQVRHPRLALALWHLAFLAGAGAAVTAIALAVADTLAVTSAHAAEAVVATVLGWIALAGVGGIIMAVAAGGDGVGTASRMNRGALLALPHSARALDPRTELRVCDAADPIACSIPDRRDTVLVTTGLIGVLTPAQLRAVVAHERAHLRQKHHWALRLADLNQACLPRSRAARELRRATGLLVELIADDSAARSSGAVHLANALTRVGAATGDELTQLRAERLQGHAWRPARLLPPVSTVFVDAVQQAHAH
ncbi:M56 family metallopeptidase [uncultured Microbacterium sp.]|uniref:M56 family metallopeptidase n=1 Tax=uncultured Microbacterium sp. TaxID=191216 RepID=UPI0025F37A28|nr:M56 family metallopeptidase [uncultured Microbacterium sp.]